MTLTVGHGADNTDAGVERRRPATAPAPVVGVTRTLRPALDAAQRHVPAGRPVAQRRRRLPAPDHRHRRHRRRRGHHARRRPRHVARSARRSCSAPSPSLVFTAMVTIMRGYERHNLGDGPDEFQAVLRASVVVAAALMALAYLTPVEVPRSAVLVGVPLLAGTRVPRPLRPPPRPAPLAHPGPGDDADHRRRGHRRRVRRGPRPRRRVAPRLPRHRGVPVGRRPGEPPRGPRADARRRSPTCRRWSSTTPCPSSSSPGNALSGDALRRLSWALRRAGAELVVAPGLVEVVQERVSMHPTAGLSLMRLEIEAAAPPAPGQGGHGPLARAPRAAARRRP